MNRMTLKVIAAVVFSLAAGAGSANAAVTPSGIPLEPMSNPQSAHVGAQATPVGVAPGSSDEKSLVCLVHALSSGAVYCL